MSDITIVFGLPGTGKSTFAAAYASAFGAVHLNTDRIRHELGRQGEYTEFDKAEIYEHLLQALEKLILEGKSVVVDGTFYKASLRHRFFGLAENLQIPLRWIQITASDETVRQRVSKIRPFTEADYAIYLKVKEVFEPLPTAHLTLDSDVLDLDEMIRQARRFIQTTG